MDSIDCPINLYTQRISSYSATASERIPDHIANYMTGVSERSQQSCSLNDEGDNLL
ncbi:hypothetical protein [Xenorhabdus littoralis]|uniref:hypothetical protein n=1 Tax=Xenorhabdus littoralis TaxID=2582835 RepID=UPI0029E81628|nr:hypothetical protein [Xenorhabdus sp. Reich]